MSFMRFILADAVAALITTPVMLGLGYFFAQHYETLLAYMHQVKIALIVVGVAGAAYLILRQIRRQRRRARRALKM